MEAKRRSEPELSSRQVEVLRLIAQGHTNGEIAEILGISLAGAKWHVSELMGKFNVETRDELAEHWEEVAGARARMSAWLGALGALITLKSVAAGAGLVVVAAGAILVAAGLNGQEDSAATVDGLAAVSATPAQPTPVLLPEAPGAMFKPEEALKRAQAAANAEIAAGRLSNDSVVKVPRAEDMTLREAKWLPGISRFDSSDGDAYWKDGLGNPRDVWQFLWVIEDVATPGDFVPSGGRIEAELLLEDGKVGEPLAFRVFLFDPRDPSRRLGGAGGFWSQRDEERTQLWTQPVGPSVRVAWLNNEVGSAWIAAYPTAAGSWCTEQHNANGERGGGGCGFDPAHLRPVSISTAATVSPTGIWTNITLEVLVQPEATTVRVVYNDGHERTYPVAKPPPELGVNVGFLYVTADSLDAPLTVIAFNDAGQELGRETQEKPAGPPPPPPSGR